MLPYIMPCKEVTKGWHVFFSERCEEGGKAIIIINVNQDFWYYVSNIKQVYLIAGSHRLRCFITAMSSTLMTLHKIRILSLWVLFRSRITILVWRFITSLFVLLDNVEPIVFAKQHDYRLPPPTASCISCWKLRILTAMTGIDSKLHHMH